MNLAGAPEESSKNSKVGNSNCRRASLSISTATKVPMMFFVEGELALNCQKPLRFFRQPEIDEGMFFCGTNNLLGCFSLLQ